MDKKEKVCCDTLQKIKAYLKEEKELNETLSRGEEDIENHLYYEGKVEMCKDTLEAIREIEKKQEGKNEQL